MKKTTMSLLVLLFLFVSIACNRNIPSEPVSSNESWQLGEMGYGQQPIWGDTFVGMEFDQGGMDGQPSQRIIIYDLKTRKTKQVIELPKSRLAEPPSIYENIIVWASVDRKEWEQQPNPRNINLLNWDVFLLDLETGKTRQLTTENHSQRSAQIYGDTVIWLDTRNQRLNQYPPPLDIYALDLKTNIETRITANTSVEGYGNLAISGNLIAWSDMRHTDASITTRPSNIANYNNEIYVYDLETKQERRVTNSPLNDYNPAIDGNRVVWLRQFSLKEADVYLNDLKSGGGQEIQISKGRYAAFGPSISGDTIIWSDARISDGNTAGDVVIFGRSGAAEIYIYNFADGKEKLLVPSQAEGTSVRRVLTNPVAYGNYAVFTNARQIGPIVYIMRLDEK